MKYSIHKRPTEHTVKLTEKDVTAAVMEWIERNFEFNIPTKARFHLDSDSNRKSGIEGRICWDDNDIDYDDGTE